MGADRALIVVALQALLMGGVRNFQADPGVAAQSHRVLATAASLDYVLMLTTDSAGTRIPAEDARRAIREGFARAVDDALVLLRVLTARGDADARSFAREGLRTVRAAIEAEALANDDRRFALIALTTDILS